jgi:uracil-DNA glycosylase
MATNIKNDSDFDISNIKMEILNRLKPSGWYDIFRMFINSQEFDDILNDLKGKVDNGFRFTPPLRDVFKAFELCPFDKLKAVILTSDGIIDSFGVYEGIPFSSGSPDYTFKTALRVLVAVSETVYNFENEKSLDKLKEGFSDWSKQGVLLLNTHLTSGLKTTTRYDPHRYIWDHFISFTLDTISRKKKNTIFCLLGDEAKSYESVISSPFIIETESPSIGSINYYDIKDWDCNDMFNKTNQFIKQIYGEKHIINW